MLKSCSRAENLQLFQAVVGGYGMFGVIYSVTPALIPDSPNEVQVRPHSRHEVAGAVAEISPAAANLQPGPLVRHQRAVLRIQDPIPGARSGSSLLTPEPLFPRL